MSYEPDDYRPRQDQRDANYREHYAKWVKELTPEQFAFAKRHGLLEPVRDDHGFGTNFAERDLAETPLHVDTSIGGDAVVAVLEQLATSRGLPAVITTDNGPEFTGRALHLWAQAANVTLNHIQPGKPMQNAFIESFNGTFRDDCLNQHWFGSLAEARLLIDHWRRKYNHLRPHSSIGRIPPSSFALMFPPNTPHSNHLSLNLA